MASEKATYWAAVGLMAVFVGNSFLVGHDVEVCRLARQAMASVEHIYSSADRLMATTDMIFGRSESTLAYSQTAFARAEAQIATMEAAMSRRQAACARVEAARARIVVMNRPVICPRQTLRLTVPQPPAIPTI
jgi:hypothetical protein